MSVESSRFYWIGCDQCGGASNDDDGYLTGSAEAARKDAEDKGWRIEWVHAPYSRRAYTCPLCIEEPGWHKRTVAGRSGQRRNDRRGKPMSDTVTITLDDRERLREIARLVEVDSGRDDAQRDARFLHRFAERPAQPPEHSQVPSVPLTEFCLQKIADLEETGAEDDFTSGQIRAYRIVVDQLPLAEQVPSVLGDEERERLRDIALRIELAVKKGDIPEVANLDAQYLRRLAEHPSSSEAGPREWLRSDEAAEAAARARWEYTRHPRNDKRWDTVTRRLRSFLGEFSEECVDLNTCFRQLIVAVRRFLHFVAANPSGSLSNAALNAEGDQGEAELIESVRKLVEAHDG